MDYTNSHTMNPSISGFIFPILKIVEIQSCMDDLGMTLSKDELTNPSNHREKLRQVFIFLLQVCAGHTEADFQASQKMLEVIESLPHPELHQEQSELRFFVCLRDLMKIAGYNDFSWRDLSHPTPKRLRFQLSAIINLAKFREEQLKVYAQLNEPRADLLQELEQVNEENAELVQQLQITELDSKSAFAEMESILQECEELELEIANQNKLQSAAREEAALLKKTALILKDQITTSVWELQAAEAKEAKLRSQIVSSPDRRKSEKVHRSEKLRQAKEALQNLENTIQTTKTKLFKATQTIKVLEPTVNVLDEITESVQTLNNLSTKMEATQSEQSALDKKLQTLHNQLSESERQLQRTEETSTHATKNRKLQLDAASEHLDLAKSELLKVEKDRRANMARIENGEKEVRNLEKQLEMETKTTEQEIQDMIAEYKTYEEQFIARTKQRLSSLTAA